MVGHGCRTCTRLGCTRATMCSTVSGCHLSMLYAPT
jgi:hypothetical protein